MCKPYRVALIGLIGLFGSPQSSCWPQEPARAKKPSRFRLGWPHRYLRAMKEPSLRELAEKDRTATAYRFLWLPAFHDPVSVRFVKSDQGVFLYTVRLKLDGKYRPVRIIRRKCVELKPVHWERIANHVAKARFWALPTTQREPFGWLTVDGHTLIVEGVSDGRYHIVVRHNPPGGNFVDLGQAMLFMSGTDVRKLWFEYRN